jgi:murein DD-endopeptidase MepM/ murein hydrolase activator NlpD
LEFSRITSGFTSARFHPVLQKWRAHRGVDYGAPVGTRVKATGNGVVEFAGVQGGYGKVVILRHQGRYTTLYGHLSGFASGLRKGNRVSQGDVIAFVGATGLASGPHLHYEFRVGDVHQNPLAIALPSAPPLMPQQLAQFQAQTGTHLARLDLIRGFNLAQSD